MKIRRCGAFAAFLLGAGFATGASAQDDGPRGPGRAVEIEGHGGILRFDGEGWKPVYGGRATFRLPSGVGIGASASFAKRPHEIGDETEDADAVFASLDLSYMLRSATRANFFATLGVGAARFDPPPSHRALGVGRATELLIPVGIGILWYNHPGRPWWAIRTDLRDNIVFLNGNPELGTDDAIANDWELSIGLSLLFGSYD